MYEPPTKKSCSLAAAIINAADNVNLAAKITITQKEGYLDYSPRHVEEELLETSKAYAKSSTKDMPQKRTATMMASSKTRNYHICETLYNIYEDHIFQNNKGIKFVSITDPSLINYKAKFGHCMELLDTTLKPDHISTLK